MAHHISSLLHLTNDQLDDQLDNQLVDASLDYVCTSVHLSPLTLGPQRLAEPSHRLAQSSLSLGQAPQSPWGPWAQTMYGIVVVVRF